MSANNWYFAQIFYLYLASSQGIFERNSLCVTECIIISSRRCCWVRPVIMRFIKQLCFVDTHLSGCLHAIATSPHLTPTLLDVGCFGGLPKIFRYFGRLVICTRGLWRSSTKRSSYSYPNLIQSLYPALSWQRLHRPYCLDKSNISRRKVQL